MADDFALLVEILIQVALVGAVVVLANVSLRQQNLAILVKAGVMILNMGLFLFAFTVLTAGDTLEYENLELGAAIIIMTVLLASVLLSDDVRIGIARVFPQRRNRVGATSESAIDPQQDLFARYAVLSDGEILNLAWPGTSLYFAQQASVAQQNASATPYPELLGFDPKNIVHALALIISVYALGIQMGLFVLGGGLSGYAEDIEINGVTLLANFLPLLILSLLGVGLFTRRSLAQVLERLGLNRPRLEDVVVGVGAAIGLFFMQAILAGIWMSIVGTETFEEQTEASGAIGDSITTIWLALGVATTAAIGEEIAFRGALQPIFGLWWTALFFTLVHMQYTLTPAAIIILLVSIAFGYMRRHYGLMTCIIAHFLYNFIPLLITVMI